MLTDVQIKALKPKGKLYRVFDGRGDGLFLEILPNGSKKWRLRYRYNSCYKCISLGAYPAVSIAEARAKTQDQKNILAAGKDPLTERHSYKSGVETFNDLAVDWQNRFSSKWAENTKKKKSLILKNYIVPALGRIPVNDITPPLILNKLLRPLEARGIVDTAHYVKMTCGQIFRYGIATGLADRDPTQDLTGALTPVTTTHRPTITDPTRIGQLLRAIDLYNGNVIVRYALKLTPMLMLRPGEIRGGEWSEIDWTEKLWRIPSERMKKGKRPHLVPLSTQAMTLLSELKTVTGDQKWIFPGARANGRPMSNMAVNVALRALGYTKDDICAHGFRGMASTLLNERGVNRDWIELQLAHCEQNSVRAAYNQATYLKDRRQMMQNWCDYLDSLKNSEEYFAHDSTMPAQDELIVMGSGRPAISPNISPNARS